MQVSLISPRPGSQAGSFLPSRINPETVTSLTKRGGAVQGSLTQGRFPDLIQSLGRKGENGVLQVSRDETEKRIYFGRGSMVFARSNLHADRLGEMLVRRGELTRANLALASNKMRARRQKLGVTLVTLGLMSKRQVRARLEEQVRGIIRSVFAWEDGVFQFRPQPKPIVSPLKLDLPAVPIILEGTRLMDIGTVRKALGNLGRVVSYTQDPCVIQHEANLTPEEGFVLSRVDGVVSLEEIVSICPLAEEDTLRCLYGLLASGFLEMGQKTREVTPSPERRTPIEVFHHARPPAAASRPEVPAPKVKEPELSPEERFVKDDIEAKCASLTGGTYYDWLEVKKTASQKEIKKAFSRMIKKYHPDRHRTPALAGVANKLETIVTKVTQAHENLSDPQRRNRYDNSLRTEAPKGEAVVRLPKSPPSSPKSPSSNERTAVRYYREAKQYFAKRDFHETVKLMEAAVELDGKKVRYHCLLAQALSRNPKWRKGAEEHFKAALALDPFDSESLIGLAELYEAVGLNRRAQALYNEAIEVDPGNAVLRVKLRSFT